MPPPPGIVHQRRHHHRVGGQQILHAIRLPLPHRLIRRERVAHYNMTDRRVKDKGRPKAA